jgi:CrcB protein
VLRQFAAVAVGSSLGGMARYAVSLLVARFWSGEFPLGTFLINVTGSFILGLFLALGAERIPWATHVRLGFATGFVGAYTTFSTFEYETERLVAAGALGWAALNVVGSLAAGFVAVRLGVILGR